MSLWNTSDWSSKATVPANENHVIISIYGKFKFPFFFHNFANRMIVEIRQTVQQQRIHSHWGK